MKTFIGLLFALIGFVGVTGLIFTSKTKEQLKDRVLASVLGVLTIGGIIILIL